MWCVHGGVCVCVCVCDGGWAIQPVTEGTWPRNSTAYISSYAPLTEAMIVVMGFTFGKLIVRMHTSDRGFVVVGGLTSG